jgi:hypothetical protein
MKSILSTFLVLLSFISYGQEPINCVVNNTVLFVPDEDRREYVIVSRHQEFVTSINYMLAYVVPKRNNIIMSFNGKEREVMYDPKKKRYDFDGGTYKSFRDLLSAVKFFLLTN